MSGPPWQKLRQLPVIGKAADWGMGPRRSRRTPRTRPRRIEGVKVTESVCPYCAVGCGQVVYTKGGKLIDIEGNPQLPDQPGHALPQGLGQPPARPVARTADNGQVPATRRDRVGGACRSRQAMDMIAERVIAAREDGWQDTNHEGWRVDRTLGFAHLGGATLDNEENYLIKKAFSAMGAVQIENQARI